jgi:hypothetical protein
MRRRESPCRAWHRCAWNSPASYLRSLTQRLDQEASMKRSNVQEQADLFSSLPAPAGLATLQHHRDELVDLLGRLLLEVVQGPSATAAKESGHEQDQR